MSRLTFRPLQEEDYETICEWWKWWRWTPVSKEMLPNNGTGGVMIQDNGVDVCAGFLYTTNSSLCKIEWIISNYKVKNKKVRSQAIQLLIDTLSSTAKELGFKVAFTYLLNENLIKKYENCGFINSSKPIEMIKKL